MATILIIDDDNQLRSVLRVALERLGHDVLEAFDGIQGINVFKQQPVDLVLCDIVMPEKEGLETISDMRRQDADVKIIAMSGGMRGGVFDFLPMAKTLGAARILQKPFDVRTLTSLVEDLLQLCK